MDINSIYFKLAEIQMKLKAPKNQRNDFGNYNYRSCEDILEAVKPLLGTMVIILSDEVVNVGDRNYVKATALLSDGEKEISVSAYACESPERKGMDAAQITGAASSYARKYALNGLFAIDDTKDADTKDNRSEKEGESSKVVGDRLNNPGGCDSCHAPKNKPHASSCPTLT